MTGAFTIFDPLLLHLADDLPQQFLIGLISGLSSTVTRKSGPSSRPENFVEASLKWLLHILTSDAWAAVRQRRHDFGDFKALLMKECLLNPGHWTDRLAHELLDVDDDGSVQDWHPLLEARQSAEDEVGGEPMQMKVDSQGVMQLHPSLNALSEREYIAEGAQALEGNQLPVEDEGEDLGWKEWEGDWIPQPIRCVPCLNV